MIIEQLDGIRHDVEDYGIKRLFHIIPSAEIKSEKSSVSGFGEVITDTTIDQRTIPVEFGFKVVNIFDYYLLRDELNALFLRDEEFFIIFKREPYKRWKVKLHEQFTIPPNAMGGKFTVSFRTVQKYAESIATTSSKKEWDEDVWWWNGAITWDDPLAYSFNTNNFNIVNLGNAKIDPRMMDVEIVITATAASYIQINNRTTGDEYRYNGALTANDTLVLKGIRTFKNSLSVFGSTNKKLLTLAPGLNDIQITGATVQNVSFNFRFPFK